MHLRHERMTTALDEICGGGSTILAGCSDVFICSSSLRVPSSPAVLCLSFLKSSSCGGAVLDAEVYCNTRPTFSDSIAGHLQLNR